MNCWEMFDCAVKENCPAYPEHGHYCARVAGTLCQGKRQVMMSRKIEGCNSCEFYNSDNYDRSFHGFVSIDRLKEQLLAAEDKLLQEVDAIDHGIDKLLDLYQNNLIGKAKLAERIQPLNRHKQEILEKLEAMRAAEGA